MELSILHQSFPSRLLVLHSSSSIPFHSFPVITNRHLLPQFHYVAKWQNGDLPSTKRSASFHSRWNLLFFDLSCCPRQRRPFCFSREVPVEWYSSNQCAHADTKYFFRYAHSRPSCRQLPVMSRRSCRRWELITIIWDTSVTSVSTYTHVCHTSADADS